jgi:PilZ domain-containing protein
MEHDELRDRLYTRYPFSAAAEIIDSSGAQMPSRVINIGFGGGRLLANGRLPIGAEVTVKVHTQADYFETEAEVVHSSATDVGVVFHNISPVFFSVLSRWISKARSASMNVADTSRTLSPQAAK